MTSLLKIQELNFSSHTAEDYVELDLYLSADHSETAVIQHKIHVVNDLKVNIFIETDILVSE